MTDEQTLARLVAETAIRAWHDWTVVAVGSKSADEIIAESVTPAVLAILEPELAAAREEARLANEAAQQANARHAQAEDILANLLCDLHYDAAWSGERAEVPCVRCNLAAAPTYKKTLLVQTAGPGGDESLLGVRLEPGDVHRGIEGPRAGNEGAPA